jgi:hypothetical protein
MHEYIHVSRYAAWTLAFATQMLFKRSVSDLFDKFMNIIPLIISTVKYSIMNNV